ncbi:MAG: tandem-95 repeat protein, partial [Acidobacteria bacterium]|nr:tandem-95 repeat protein [Acidobacteriota bacterium]
SYDLLPESPAIDAGDDSVTDIPFLLAYDQRGAGFTRKYGSHVDIGAIETFPPNTAPTASAQTVSAIEDIAKAITLSASDAEKNSLTYTVTNPSNGALSGTAPNLTYTPNANFNGSDSFTFKANDGKLNSNVATVTITVAAVNDAPTFTKGADRTVLEDAGAQSISGFLSNISTGPADESGQLISFPVTGNTNFLLFSSAPTIDATGNLTFTAKPDAYGSSTITFSAQDSGTTSNGGVNTSATQTFVINITPVNDAPSFTKGANQIVNEDAGAQSIAGWATAISAGPANESGQTVSFEVSNNTNGLFSAQPTVSSAGVLTYTPAANANGTATVALRIKDNGGTDNSGVDASVTQSFTITVNSVNDAPLASNDKATQGLQYSDAIQTINIGGTDIDSQSVTASVSFTKDGGTAQAGLPSGMTLSSPAICTASTTSLIGAGTSCGWTVSGRAMVAPGTYVVTVTVSDGALSNSTGFTITVNREDARATYTGALFAATSTVSSGTATVTLAATIQDISAILGNPDTLPGDIRNATVRFVNRDAGDATLCTASGIGLVNLSDLTVGTATCNWTANIGTSDAQSFTVGIVVEGFYTRNDAADNTVVTVSKPIAGVVSGGGYLLLTSSGGQRAGDAGTKNNFGFNIKNDRNGPKGNINVIVRRMESDGILHAYQIKGNAMTSLVSKFATSTTPGTATFNGKANIQDITFANDPVNPRVISVDGGASLQVVMTDRGEPGSSDSIAVTLWDKNGGLWFASKWDGVKTVEQTLGGGNLQVR